MTKFLPYVGMIEKICLFIDSDIKREMKLINY